MGQRWSGIKTPAHSPPPEASHEWNEAHCHTAFHRLSLPFSAFHRGTAVETLRKLCSAQSEPAMRCGPRVRAESAGLCCHFTLGTSRTRGASGCRLWRCTPRPTFRPRASRTPPPSQRQQQHTGWRQLAGIEMSYSNRSRAFWRVLALAQLTNSSWLRPATAAAIRNSSGNSSCEHLEQCGEERCVGQALVHIILGHLVKPNCTGPDGSVRLEAHGAMYIGARHSPLNG